jgi:hypothetical protein
MDRLPNFFIIGAPKCGTTSLSKWLAGHPEVYFSPIKEPHFFNTDENWFWRGTEKKYLKLFEKVKTYHKAIGEGSVWYLNSKVAVSNIEKFTNKNAKYIVCLRNPIEMVVSLHNQLIVTGIENILDFNKAWKMSEHRNEDQGFTSFYRQTSHLHYKNSCLLGQQVQRLFENVPRDRIHFVFIEDMKSNPEKIYNQVIHFLNLTAHKKNDFVKENSSKKLRSGIFKKVLLFLGFLKIKMGIPFNFGLLNKMEKFNEISGKYPDIDLELEKELKEYFFNDIELLENLVQRDLSEWKR